jgi:hypothetical protein
MGMEIISANAGLVTNFEALKLLQERREQREKNEGPEKKKKKKKLVSGDPYHHRNWLQDKTLGYLVSTPANYLTQASIEKFVSELKANKKIELTQAEVLQIINLRPSTAVEVHAIIDECAERLTDEVVEGLITSINNTLEPDLGYSADKLKEALDEANISTQDMLKELDVHSTGEVNAQELMEGLGKIFEATDVLDQPDIERINKTLVKSLRSAWHGGTKNDQHEKIQLSKLAQLLPVPEDEGEDAGGDAMQEGV